MSLEIATTTVKSEGDKSECSDREDESKSSVEKQQQPQSDDASVCCCSTYCELEKTFMGELQFMLREFKRLEQQLLWKHPKTTSAKADSAATLPAPVKEEEESPAARVRREKLQAFIKQLEGIINDINVNAAKGSSCSSSNSSTSSTAVARLEKHIRNSILPVKVRLLKQLSAQGQHQRHVHRQITHQQRNFHVTGYPYNSSQKNSSSNIATTPFAFANTAKNTAVMQNIIINNKNAASVLTQKLYRSSNMAPSPAAPESNKNVLPNESSCKDVSPQLDSKNPAHSIIAAPVGSAVDAKNTPQETSSSSSSCVFNTTGTDAISSFSSSTVPLNPLETNTPTSRVHLSVASASKSNTNASMTASQGITAETEKQQPLVQERAENNNEMVATKDALISHAPVKASMESKAPNQCSEELMSFFYKSTLSPADGKAINTSALDMLCDVQNEMLLLQEGSDTSTIVPVGKNHTVSIVDEQRKQQLMDASSDVAFEIGNGKPSLRGNGEICSMVAPQQKNKRKKTRKKKKIAHVLPLSTAVVSDQHPNERSIPTIYEKTDKASSNTCKDPMISFSSAGNVGGISSTNQSTKDVSNRHVELTCASCNEIYTMPIHTNSNTTNNHNSSIHNNTSKTLIFNPWWSLRRESCPKCNQVQIPRIDISSPANFLEYHPALLAHITNEQQDQEGSSAAQASTSMPSAAHQCFHRGINQIPPICSNAFYNRSNQNHTLNNAAESINGDNAEEDLCSGSSYEDCSDNDSDISTAANLSLLYESEDFGKNYSGPLLADLDAARLLILINHASTCPGRHKSVKCSELCQSVKYLMLHVRDCPGYLTIPNCTIRKTSQNDEADEAQALADLLGMKHSIADNDNDEGVICKMVQCEQQQENKDVHMNSNTAGKLTEEKSQRIYFDEDSDADSSEHLPVNSTKSTTMKCPFSWCRPVKHLLYHLVSCTAGQSCLICHPRDISDNMATLTSLNAFRRSKRHKANSATVNTTSNLEIATKKLPGSVPSCATTANAHPGNPSLMTDDELLMKTSESFLLPHTFPSLPGIHRLFASNDEIVQFASEESPVRVEVTTMKDNMNGEASSSSARLFGRNKQNSQGVLDQVSSLQQTVVVQR